MKCKIYQENISSMLDNELGEIEKQATLVHAKSCSQCQATLERLESSQRLLEEHVARQAAPAHIESILFQRIASSKREKATEWSLDSIWLSIRQFVVPPKPWMRFAAVAVVFLLAVIAGIRLQRKMVEKHVREEANVASTGVPANDSMNRTNYVEPGLPSYIEKSTIVLMQIQNGRYEGKHGIAELSEEKKLAKELLVESKMISQEISRKRHKYLSELVTEMEPVLIEVANLDPQGDSRSLEIVRKAIKENDYLLKLQLAKAIY